MGPATHPMFGTPTVGAGVSESAPSGAPKSLITEGGMMRFAIEVRREVGAPFPVHGPLKLPSAWNESDPLSYFPAIRVDQDATLNEANWPYLVPHLRGTKLEHSGVSLFAATGWAVLSNVVTLTFVNASTENQVLAGLEEDKLFRGGYRTVTIPDLGASVPAGTYAISTITPGSHTITFPYTTGNASGGGVSVEFHLNRIAGSNNTAKWYKSNGAAFMTPGDDNGSFIHGLSRRGHFQGHRFNMLHYKGATGSASIPGTGDPGLANYNYQTGDPVTDGVNGTPRTGPDTHGPGMVAYHYIWGMRYIS